MNPQLLRLGLATGAMIWVAQYTEPLMQGGNLNYITAFVYFFIALGSINFLIELLHVMAWAFEVLSTREVTGKEGTARWARYRDIKPEINPNQDGPFWGCLEAKMPVFIDFVSNAMAIAPAGSGKGITNVILNILAIRCSKVIVDFKGELSCICKDALEKLGEKVIILNCGDLWSDILGKSAYYNPLEFIVQNLFRKDGIRDIISDLRELAAQLYPEPEGKAGDDKYWRDGSRKLIAFAGLIEIMIEEDCATLGGIARLLEDRMWFEDNLRWIIGIDNEGNPTKDRAPIEQTHWAQNNDPQDMSEFANYVRAQASNILSMMTGPESRTFDNFVSGAQLALAPFAVGRLSKYMQRSDFSMNDLKDSDQPVSLFIVADSSRMEIFKPYLGLIQWAALTAMKRHETKKRPVYFVCDEATNYKIHDLESLLTWGRSYGIRLLLVFQDLAAYERVYGKNALDTLLSETEIKLFLPGQRNQKTVELIKKMLGQQSVMSASLSQQQAGLHSDYREEGRPLMSEEEITKTPFGILFVRQLPSILVKLLSYGAIHPWRDMVGINPFYGKPFMQKVQLKLGGIWRKLT